METDTPRAWPDIAIPPGQTIEEEIAARGISKGELAMRMGRPPQAISEILSGNKEITPETAAALERVLGMSAQFWLNLEAAYRYNKARLEREANEQHEATTLLPRYPYTAMARLGWVPPVTRRIERLHALYEFFGAASLRSIAATSQAAYRVADRSRVSPEALAAWLRQGEREAARISNLRPFHKQTLIANLPDMRRLAASHPPDFFTRLKQICAGCGVALVYVPHLPGTFANGAVRWYGPKDCPLVQVTIRGRYADIFWFSFFHEIGHILRHDRRSRFVELEPGAGPLPGATAQQEQEANRFAADTLIPPEQFERLIGMTYSEANVRHMAQLFGISPGIIVGRLQHERLLPPTHLNGLRVKLAYAGPEASP